MRFPNSQLPTISLLPKSYPDLLHTNSSLEKTIKTRAINARQYLTHLIETRRAAPRKSLRVPTATEGTEAAPEISATKRGDRRAPERSPRDQTPRPLRSVGATPIVRARLVLLRRRRRRHASQSVTRCPAIDLGGGTDERVGSGAYLGEGDRAAAAAVRWGCAEGWVEGGGRLVFGLSRRHTHTAALWLAVWNGEEGGLAF